jgi:nucleolar complex protein 3
MILQTFIDVFKSDLTSVYSQTLLRLIARMIKERKFQVHPNILSCLLHLRLRSELDLMRDKSRAKRDAKEKDRGRKGPKEKNQGQFKSEFKSEIRKKWQTKNQKKREKEMKEVEKEMGEAAAEVDLEERAGVVSTSQHRACSILISSKPRRSRTYSYSTFPSSRTQFEHPSFQPLWRVSPISLISSMSISSVIS